MRPSKTNDPTIVVAFCELALKKRKGRGAEVESEEERSGKKE